MVTTEVTNVSYFSKIKNALAGVLFGFLLVGGSIWGLFSNEGRVDLSILAEDAVQTFNQEELSQNDEKLVVLTGDIELDNVLEDDIVSLEDALVLNKKMEAFAWVENVETKTETRTGGSDTKTTTYSYSKEWVTNVQDSSKFKESAEHQNPELSLQSDTFRAAGFGIEGINFDTEGLRLPSASESVIDELTLKDDFYVIDGDFVYDGFGTVSDPEIGDVRISYTGIPSLTRVSLFGVWDSNLESVTPFIGKRDAKLFGLYRGDATTAKETMHKEYTTAKWGMRIGMLLLMFVGFSMILAPLHTVLDVIPMFGRLGKSVVGLVSFFLTLVIGGVVILLGKVWYSWVIILAILGFGFAGFKYWEGKKS